MSTSTGILEVDWNLVRGLVLVSLLLMVGFLLHRAGPAPASATAKSKEPVRAMRLADEIELELKAKGK
jgi:hypothetical protein